MYERRVENTHLICTPLDIYDETFLDTHCSAAFELLARVASMSFGIPTITSIPDLARAFKVPASASNSFTF